MSAKNIILDRISKLHPKIIDLSLYRVFNLLHKLENPHLDIPPAIHIAGTNGKGSTLAFIKAGLESNNKIVHSYTSPHLVDFNERIRLKGKKIDDSLLIEYLETCEQVNKTNEITFFEIITCAAFIAFSKHRADYTLLEVGLGGKLDATNVINSPCLSIITPISLDHQQFLGNSVIDIAAEKAGILKPGVQAIVGKQEDAVNKKISAIARNNGTPISLFGRDWSAKKHNNFMIYEDNDGIIELPAPRLEGIHQFENAGIAINALKILNIKNKNLEHSLQKVNWPARLHKLKSGPLVEKIKNLPVHADIWIDGGHNQAAARSIGSFLSQPFYGTSHVILGMINSKDVNSFVSEISVFTDSIACINIPDEPASLNKDKMLKQIKPLKANTFVANTASHALDTIINQNYDNGNIRILICGSLYLCGHILRDHK